MLKFWMVEHSSLLYCCTLWFLLKRPLVEIKCIYGSPAQLYSWCEPIILTAPPTVGTEHCKAYIKPEILIQICVEMHRSWKIGISSNADKTDTFFIKTVPRLPVSPYAPMSWPLPPPPPPPPSSVLSRHTRRPFENGKIRSSKNPVPKTNKHMRKRRVSREAPSWLGKFACLWLGESVVLSFLVPVKTIPKSDLISVCVFGGGVSVVSLKDMFLSPHTLGNGAHQPNQSKRNKHLDIVCTCKKI